MFAEHLHHPPVAGQMDVIILDRLHPDPIRGFEDAAEPVRFRFVGAEDAEIPLGIIELQRVA